VIDGDGHLIENFPLLASTIDRLFGLAAVESFVTTLQMDPMVTMGDRAAGEPRGPWWGISNEAADVATAAIPARLAQRMDGLGLDYAVMYPTLGLGFATIRDSDVRGMACRGLNTMAASLCNEHADRMTAAALIPMHDPDEALREARHVIEELGAKVVVIAPGVGRPLEAHPQAFPAAHRIDRFGLDSDFDYDPLWQYLVDRRVPLSIHGGVGYRYLPPPQGSPTNYVANHVLGHGALLIEVAKSLVLGGVYRRFPDLHIAYLEGGASWAVDMMHSMVEHFEKRGPKGLAELDPHELDLDVLTAAFRSAGMPPADPRRGLMAAGEPPEGWGNEFSESGLENEQQIVALFRDRFFLGCEGDDRSVRRAFDGAGNLDGARLAAFFSSDIGHWDVPRLAPVLLHSRALVNDGAMTNDDYREFVFSNAVRFHAGANPEFFNGTVVEQAAAAELAHLAGT
jgi:predicted TIM-barrel fold metal-dependent hydrolase